MDYKRMHCQEEIEAELKVVGDGYLPLSVIQKWSCDHYSTSKHLLTLYSIVRGLNAQTVGEIGAGRSSYALALAAKENGGKFYMCDRYDYRNLLTAQMRQDISYTVGFAKDLFRDAYGGFDFVFLDYLSNTKLMAKDVIKEIGRAIKNLKRNGIIAVHDGITDKYECGKALSIIREMDRKSVEVMTLPYNNGLTLIRKLEYSAHGTVIDAYSGKKKDPGGKTDESRGSSWQG